MFILFSSQDYDNWPLIIPIDSNWGATPETVTELKIKMDFGNNSSSSNNKSPVLTIKRGAGRQKQGQWQDFIDREHSTVDHLLQDSFATFCSELSQKNQVSSPKYNYHTLDSNMRSRKKSRNSPEKVSRELEDVDGLHLPPGIAELENLYAPMKNLSHHLPSNQNSSTSSWRQIEPFKVSRPQKQPQEIRDDESEICSVIIPPPLAPVQSHSILGNLLKYDGIFVHF